MKQNLSFIFVHGLSGWGSYDKQYRSMPYWGMRGGDLMQFLNSLGYACFAASVAPKGSAWDRACELYAQLTGTRTDYGAVHSRKYGHARFGRDFSDKPLLPAWGPETRLVLLGHSFGGVTVRLFSELLANGDADEKAGQMPDGLNINTEEISPLFLGGMGDRIHSIITLAAPTNGTTAYDLFQDPAFHPEKIRVPWWSRILASMMSRGVRPRNDGRDERDYAAHDMQIDHALALNKRIATLPHVYYFAVPCSFTEKQADGTHRPKRGIEPLFVMRSSQIGAYTGKSAGGIVFDEVWQENDGLVNTVSAGAPMGEPARQLDIDLPGSGRIRQERKVSSNEELPEREPILPGIWNVFPPCDGDHMYPQGGLVRKHDIRGFYQELLDLVAAL